MESAPEAQEGHASCLTKRIIATRIQYMQKMLTWSLAVSCAVAGSVMAAEDERESVCTRLESALEQQVEALEKVKDAADAAEAVSKVNAALQAQKALFGVDETELWQYIDRTPQTKVALMRMLQRLAAEVDRISKENFYGNADLKKLLF